MRKGTEKRRVVTSFLLCLRGLLLPADEKSNSGESEGGKRDCAGFGGRDESGGSDGGAPDTDPRTKVELDGSDLGAGRKS